MQDLVICTSPIVDKQKRSLTTIYDINESEEISITINENVLITKEDLYEIINNEIVICDHVEIDFEKDSFIVVYCKI